LPDNPEYLAVADDEVGPLKSASPGSGRERAVILGAVLLQFAVLVAMITRNTVPYIGGQTVLLRVVPVDPRDLMRGDYVTLSYDISRMAPTMMGGHTPGDASNRKVYVSLEAESDSRHFKGSAASFTRPPTGPYIQGAIAGGGQINFGIESYYVQEGQGHDYEKAVRERRLSAEVVLGYDGLPSLRGLVIE
jgi:uncharacterized membrane-anchored protein